MGSPELGRVFQKAKGQKHLPSARQDLPWPSQESHHTRPTPVLSNPCCWLKALPSSSFLLAVERSTRQVGFADVKWTPSFDLEGCRLSQDSLDVPPHNVCCLM